MGHMNNDKKKSAGGNSWKVLFREDIKPIRKQYPRGRLPGGLKGYLDVDKLMARPLLGLHKISRAAEYLVAKTRRKVSQNPGNPLVKNDPGILVLFEKITRYQHSILCTFGRRNKPTPNEIDNFRRFIREQRDRIALCDTRLSEGLRTVHCPLFNIGDLPLMTHDDAQLLVDILVSAKAAGNIPSGSMLNIQSLKLKTATAEVLRRVYLNA